MDYAHRSKFAYKKQDTVVDGKISRNAFWEFIDIVTRIYNYADVFHCEPIGKVSDDFIQRNHILNGTFDNITSCKYTVPDYWDIGEVFERLIEDTFEEKDVIKGIFEIYHSWIADRILNFNSDLYYQSRDYIAACYKEGEILTA